MSKDIENQLTGKEIQESELKEALSIVELEERFEMSIAADDCDRCCIETESSAQLQ